MLLKNIDHPNLLLIQHPLLADSLSHMRNKETENEKFARDMNRAAPFIAYEALSDLELKTEKIDTPVAPIDGQFLESKDIVLVSVLGAGQAFITGISLYLLPWARSAWIAAKRNEDTHEPELSYERLPEDMSNSLVLVVDPMLATGGSSSAVIKLLKKKVGAKNIRFINLVAAPEGVKRMNHDHPDVMIYSLALDEGLTETAYITPGLGDAGDRYTGTTPR